MKISTKILLMLSAFSLAACQTTGSSSGNIATSKLDDSKLTCEQIAAESAEMDQLIAEANQTKSGQHMANVGTSVASHAALHSGALGSVPFLGSMMGAANSLQGAQKVSAQNADQVIQQANMRKATLSGLYSGKDC